MSTRAGRLAPPFVRRGIGRLRGEVVRATVLGDLQRIARSGRPIVAGPWLGEVGFEILYWIPFLRWALAEGAIEPGRVTAISRGGPSSWYAGVAGTYADVFDVMDADTFRAANEQRRLEIGEQKQVRGTRLDETIVAAVARGGDVEVLHPSLMYRLMRPFWWQHATDTWVFRHQRVAPIRPPALPPAFGVRPGEYVAVKFYLNDCVEDTVAARRSTAALTGALARRLPVVSLTTGLRIDDHDGADAGPGVPSLAGRVSPRDNLDVQTALVAHARAFVGTYGGFSYLAPLCGVAAVAGYTRADGFDPAHLRIARAVAARLGAPPFELVDLGGVDAEAVADRLVGA
ncbi:MAG: hypothetical protein AB7O67_04195 [Vicinamibacterales bacterium]